MNLKLLSACVWVLLATTTVQPVFSATHHAASPARQAVLDAIAAASPGDTVTIGAGIADWSSAITISKGITVIGAGAFSQTAANNTIIRNTQSGEDSPLIYIALSVDVPLTIKGIKFVDSVGHSNSAIYSGDSRVFETKLRITECKFENFKKAFKVFSLYGVVDNCTFLNNRVSVRNSHYAINTSFPGEGVLSGRRPWNSSNTLVFEDCTFTVDNSYPWGGDYYMLGDTEHPSDYTIRYSTMNMMILEHEGFDMHGPEWNTSANNNVGIKIYRNKIYWPGSGSKKFVAIRGGNGSAVHDNTFYNVTSSLPYMKVYFPNGNDSSSQLKAYFWNNVVNGTTIAAGATAPDPRPIEGNHFFNSAPAGYSELQYPHPLRNGLTVTPGSFDFGVQASGSSTDKTFQVQNTTSGTVTGSASTGAPFSIVGSADYTLAPQQSTTITVRYSPVVPGSVSRSLVFSGGGGTAVLSGRTTVPVGQAFSSDLGLISAPFSASDGVVSQAVLTVDPAQGGKALYDFIITHPGTYLISALLATPDTGANSLFINVDAEPVAPGMIWDLPVSATPVLRTSNWSGVAKSWNLAAGPHQLILRGREGGVQIGNITIQPVMTAPGAPAGFSLQVN